MSKIDNARAARLSMARQLSSSGRGREIRQRADLRLAEVARFVDVAHVTILRWELGRRRPTGDKAMQWADLMLKLDATTRAMTP
jgi:transcriptional regulator with XRE-family HTH domain